MNLQEFLLTKPKTSKWTVSQRPMTEVIGTNWDNCRFGGARDLITLARVVGLHGAVRKLNEHHAMQAIRVYAANCLRLVDQPKYAKRLASIPDDLKDKPRNHAAWKALDKIVYEDVRALGIYGLASMLEGAMWDLARSHETAWVSGAEVVGDCALVVAAYSGGGPMSLPRIKRINGRHGLRWRAIDDQDKYAHRYQDPAHTATEWAFARYLCCVATDAAKTHDLLWSEHVHSTLARPLIDALAAQGVT